MGNLPNPPGAHETVMHMYPFSVPTEVRCTPVVFREFGTSRERACPWTLHRVRLGVPGGNSASTPCGAGLRAARAPPGEKVAAINACPAFHKPHSGGCPQATVIQLGGILCPQHACSDRACRLKDANVFVIRYLLVHRCSWPAAGRTSRLSPL